MSKPPPKKSPSGKPVVKSTGAKAKVTSKAVVPMKSHPMSVIESPSGEKMLAPKGYTMRQIQPAKNYDVLSFARAMNPDLGPKVKKLFDPEREAAIEAQKTGIYIGWRCPEFKWDCQRVGRSSKCFCGHTLAEHANYNGRSFKVPCQQHSCKCKAFAWIPSRAEEVGEFWMQRRRNFDPSTWRAKCNCKHTHEDHDPTGLRSCRSRGCGCGSFNSNFLCAACDKHWEQHETFFETENDRRTNGLPVGEDYLPFAELPNLRNMVLTGRDDDDSEYLALTEGEGSIPQSKPHNSDSPVKYAGRGGFKPVYD